MRTAQALLVAVACAASLGAGERGPAGGALRGTIKVVDSDGAVVSPAGAIVYIVGFAEEPPRQAATIEQRNRRFVPELVAITAGQEVSFPNRDALLHNVFSSSGARPFDLGSYKQGESKRKAFPKLGVIDVYCNIHPEMAATILVLPNRRWVRVDDSGRFSLEGVPPGRWTAFAYARLASKPVSAPIEIADGAATTVDLTIVRGAAQPHSNKYGEAYRDPKAYRRVR
ncbi:MAG: hypothetical protein R3B48_21350 [Kofleriaceae bacterium]